MRADIAAFIMILAALSADSIVLITISWYADADTVSFITIS